MPSGPLARAAHNGSASRERFPWPYFVILGAIILVAFVGALVAYVLKFAGTLSEKQEHWGQFSDYLGGVMNPLIGVAGFVAVILTLRQQHRQLWAEREEFHREQLAREESERIARLLRLIEIWDTDEYQNRMIAAMGAIRRLAGVQGRFSFPVAFAHEIPGTAEVIKIYAFFLRLELMLKSGLVRAEDVRNLFYEDIRQWMARLSTFDFEVGDQTGAPPQAEFDELREWFRLQVQPLAERFGIPGRIDPRPDR